VGRGELSPGVAKLRDLFLAEAERGRVLGIVPILGIYRALLVKPYDWVPCGAGQHSFAINTDGRVLHCPIAVSEKWATAGHIKIGLNGGTPRLKDKCLRCEYRHVCGGRCLYTHYEDYWGAEGFDAVCAVTKKTIRLLEEAAPRLKILIDTGRIARDALNYDPLLDSTVGRKAVLLDEVFEGLSPKMRDDIAQVIREYINTTGAAVLVAESNPEYVKFATYVYRIHRGVATPLEKTKA
jgi:putative peptide-modifying radical SAM enzyme